MRGSTPVPPLTPRPRFGEHRPRKLYLGLALIGLLIASLPAKGKEPGAPLEGRRSDSSPIPALDFGFKTGLSISQSYGTEERYPEYTVTSSYRTSSAAFLFLHLPVTERFGIQYEIGYVRKGSRQDIEVEILEIPTVLDVAYDMEYIDIPVMWSYKWLDLRGFDVRSLAGFSLSLKVDDHYTLSGEISDGEQVVPITADSDMSEVDMFDYSFLYGTGLEFAVQDIDLILEWRFTIGWNVLAMPTYAYVPFGDEQQLIDNEPVPLRNQNHLILLGLRF
ncbi:MAG: outer membrane beta-barrel protein [Candidatus Eisenbacteria bacterium]|nr:outer membrane beta-barrel protein [Candidatus Eisenbacteria bacterium]